MALNLGPLNVLLRLQGADKFKRDAKGSAKSLDLIGKASVAATAAIAATGYQAVKATQVFAEFEKGMTRVGAVTNSLGTTAFAGLTERAQELASTTEFTARQVADAMGFMGMAGMSTNQIFDATPAVLQLASAGMVDVASAADTVTNIMAGFGLEAKDLNDTNNVLVATFTNSNTSLQGLGETFKYAGSVAKIAGLSLKQTAAIIGLMGNAGHQASVAGTALRSTLLRLQGNLPKVRRVVEKYGLEIKDSSGKMKDFSEIFRQLGPVVKNASDAQDLFGTYAVAAMSAAVEQGTGALDKMIGKIEGAGNVAERISAAQLNTLDGRIKIMQSNFEGLQIAIGKALGPAAVKIVDNMSIVFGDLKDAIDGVGVGLLDSESWASGLTTLKNLVLAVASAIDTIAQFAIKAVMFPITLLTRAIAEAEFFIGTMMKAFKNIPGMRGVFEAGVEIREQGISRRENLQQLMSDISATKPLEDSLRSFFTMFESGAKELGKAVDGAGAGAGGAGAGAGGAGVGAIRGEMDFDAARAAHLREIAKTSFESAMAGDVVSVLAKAGYKGAMVQQLGAAAPLAQVGDVIKPLVNSTDELAKKQAQAAEEAAALAHNVDKASQAFGKVGAAVMGGTLGATFGADIAESAGTAIGSLFGGAEIGGSIGRVAGELFGPTFDVIVSLVGALKPFLDLVNTLVVALLLPLVVSLTPAIADLSYVLGVLIPVADILGGILGAMGFVVSFVTSLVEAMGIAIENFIYEMTNGLVGQQREFQAFETPQEYLARLEEERAKVLEELNGETNTTTDRFRELNEELTNVPIGIKKFRAMQFESTRGVVRGTPFGQSAFGV